MVSFSWLVLVALGGLGLVLGLVVLLVIFGISRPGGSERRENE